MSKRVVLFFLLLSFLILSCKHDVENEVPNGPSCDLSNVTYSSTITGIISKYSCLSCHSGSAPTGGFSLEGYSNVKAKVTDGRLFGAINHSPGYAPMPDGQPKMDQCDINKVKTWIDAGAPNN
jgi:hypothetical protein